MRSVVSSFVILAVLCAVRVVTEFHGQAQSHEAEDAGLVAVLIDHEYDLSARGREFLLRQAEENEFFLLGELHGENEIPELIGKLWPAMWRQGYRHIAAEVSPWAANQLEFVRQGNGPAVVGLWSKQEAVDVRRFADSSETVLWGCDMEEMQPQMLIAELTALDAEDPNLQRMAEITRKGYRREQAPKLLELIGASKSKADKAVNGIFLRANLFATLKIETNRLNPAAKMIAQNERERLMKTQFLAHYGSSSSPTRSKVFLRFGRNHLHRGYDGRGVSTLGNFIAEFAVTQDKRSFNVGAFGAGGQATLSGNTWNADERHDELAFALLAEYAKFRATVFDLRPIRSLLHAIPQDRRTPLQNNLTYWADSYDALICYKTVTPLKSPNSVASRPGLVGDARKFPFRPGRFKGLVR